MEVRERPPSFSKTSIMAPWEAMLKIREHPPPILKTSMAALWEALTEVWERPPPFSKTLMVGLLGGDAGDPGTSTTYLEDINGKPPGR
jgi:hypothetical protein